MKILLLLAMLLCINQTLQAQNNDLKTVYVNEQVSTHFVLSEPVQYVDISTNYAVSDIPLSNVVRLRPKDKDNSNLGIVTIITQQYMVQYQLVYGDVELADKQVLIKQQDGVGLMLNEVNLTYEDMTNFCTKILQKKEESTKAKVKRNDIDARLNHVYTIGDYFLVDIAVLNHSNIPFNIDQIRFKIEDKKIVKATNYQQMEIEPEYQYHHQVEFHKKYRNVFVFKKFTYPNQKVFTIELAEKQISGRNITLKINYKDVLRADAL